MHRIFFRKPESWHCSSEEFMARYPSRGVLKESGPESKCLTYLRFHPFSSVFIAKKREIPSLPPPSPPRPGGARITPTTATCCAFGGNPPRRPGPRLQCLFQHLVSSVVAGRCEEEETGKGRSKKHMLTRWPHVSVTIIEEGASLHQWVEETIYQLMKLKQT